MRLAEVSAPVDRVATFDVVAGDPLTLSGGKVWVSATEGDVLSITDHRQAVLVRPQGSDDAAVGRAIISAGPRAVVEALSVTDEEISLRSIEFASRVRLFDTRDVAVDDDVLEMLPSGFAEDVDSACIHLRDTFVVDDAPPWVIAMAGLEEDLTTQRAMRLLGNGIAIDIAITGDMLRITRVVTGQVRHAGPRHVLEGELRFVDATYAAKLDAVQRKEFERLYESESAYFNVWQKYGDLEYSQAEERARALGVARYTEVRQNRDGSYVFFLALGADEDALLDRLGSRGADLEAGASPPDPSRSTPGGGRLHGTAKVDGLSGPRCVRVSPHRRMATAPPTRGYLYGSVAGDLVRRDRRMAALDMHESVPRKAIRQLLEGVAPAVDQRRRRIQPMSKGVLEAFGGQPTDAQLRALDIALNTPDIAIIQGPPGTGKTRVIAALQVRLAEVARKQNALENRVLLAAEQHVAVRNAMGASVDRRLPAVKLGNRRGSADDEHLLEWAHVLREGLEQRAGEHPQSRLLTTWFDLQDQVAAFRAATTSGARSAADLLTWMRREASQMFDDGLKRELDTAILRLEGLARTSFRLADLAIIEPQVRALRPHPIAFADDGPRTCRRLAATLRRLGIGPADDVELLEAMASREELDPLEVPRLLHLKERLLDVCARSRQSAQLRSADAALQDLISRCSQAATTTLERRVDPVEFAVARFARRLRDEPTAVRGSVLRHTSSLAATCQQAAGRDIRRVQLDSAPFDTVIIDEAARANPLDLLIPVALGSRRVVFVGDHRQLPQMLEPSVRDAMTKDAPDNAMSSVLETSFFERLFAATGQRSEGVRRTVTLDRQFRMDPALGDFLNQYFYAPHGEHLGNGIGAEDRSTNGLPLPGPATWFDVDRARGFEERGQGRSGPSYRRPAEAERAIDLAQQILGGDTTRTVGIVTFYTGQERCLWAELERRHLAIRDGEAHRLSPAWETAFADSGVPRLHIGTVDSFQGREFDVVLLSLVRSNDHGIREPAHRYRAFGFLAYPNRLCVAMSRQRDALVVLGDAETFASEQAREAVPAIHGFLELAVQIDG